MKSIALRVAAIGLAVGLAPSAAGAVTLCQVTAPLRLAGVDIREGAYVGEWRDAKTGVKSCAALVIERFHANYTVTAVYFFGAEPVWRIENPGFRRETYKVRDDTLVLESLTHKYEFKLKGWDIEATYEDANGVKTKGKLRKDF